MNLGYPIHFAMDILLSVKVNIESHFKNDFYFYF